MESERGYHIDLWKPSWSPECPTLINDAKFNDEVDKDGNGTVDQGEWQDAVIELAAMLRLADLAK